MINIDSPTTKVTKKKFIPSHIQIETVNRMCNARCTMCPIKFVPDWEVEAKDELSYNGVSRRPQIMTLENFKTIAAKFGSYTKYIRFLSLHGCGEPLLDKSLSEKIAFAKKVGFTEVGFTSNCSPLTPKISKKLLEAGLNCIIPSIDGFTKDVQETIRPRTKFEDVYYNVKEFIKIRDEGNYDCKVLIRMIKQQLNHNQWDEYFDYWSKILTPSKGDSVLQIDIHNWGEKIPDYDNKRVDGYDDKISSFVETLNLKDASNTEAITKALNSNEEYICVKSKDLEDSSLCPDLFSRLSIFASGDVGLCCVDTAGYFDLGNVLNQNPIDVFNNKNFIHYRDKWLKREPGDLDYCKDCTTAISRFNKNYTS